MLFGLTLRPFRFARVVVSSRETRTFFPCAAVAIWLCALSPVFAQAPQPPPTTVPDVTNRPLETALAMIDKAGLARGRIVDRESDGQPGIVLDQSIKPGTRVARGTAISLLVSQVPLVTVPNVINRPVGTAEGILKDAQLTRGQITNRETDGEPGMVLDQRPRPGDRVPRGSAVNLLVSQVPLVTVPNVINRPVGAAEGILKDAQLTRGQITNRETDGEPGMVLDQKPRPGDRVPRGTAVSLLVSQVVLVTVPNVTSRPVPTAEGMLKDAQLTRGQVTTRETDGEPGIVLEQRPRAGERVARGTAVSLLVSQAAPVTVPNVTNRPVGTAEGMLKDAQLTRGQITTRDTDGEPGMVLDQKPRPGERVSRGTAVSLLVSQAAPVTVPNVTNRPVGTAEGML
jgi:serine/threonine-protein kinase